MESGLGGPDGDAKAVRYLGQREPEVVVEDEDGPLLDRQPAEATFELIAVVDGEDLAGVTAPFGRKDVDVDGPATLPPRLGITLVDDDPMEPGLEPIGVAQRPELAPCGDERSLHRILGSIPVMQDATGDAHAAIADQPSQGVEGLDVALLRTIHERSMHQALLASRPVRVARSQGRCIGILEWFNLALAGVCRPIRRL
jgi:hypothetical protein